MAGPAFWAWILGPGYDGSPAGGPAGRGFHGPLSVLPGSLGWFRAGQGACGRALMRWHTVVMATATARSPGFQAPLPSAAHRLRLRIAHRLPASITSYSGVTMTRAGQDRCAVIIDLSRARDDPRSMRYESSRPTPCGDLCKATVCLAQGYVACPALSGVVRPCLPHWLPG
jgi:hypothetical protein